MFQQSRRSPRFSHSKRSLKDRRESSTAKVIRAPPVAVACDERDKTCGFPFSFAVEVAFFFLLRVEGFG